MAEERLQKVLAAAGIGSRRSCEDLIRLGRVQVDGQKVTVLGTKVDPTKVEIVVNGQPLQKKLKHVYIKLHKPRDVLSDIGGNTRGRESVADLLPPDFPRVFPVGRLDVNSEGLILLTDDGALANKLTHPRYQHPKAYYVLVDKRPSEIAMNQLRSGIELPDGYVTARAQATYDPLPEWVKLDSGRTNGHWLRIVLREGKKRQIRHMTAAIGHPTLRLIRWSIGSMTLGDLRSRESAPLTKKELSGLRELAAKPVPDPKQEKKQRSRKRSNRKSNEEEEQRRKYVEETKPKRSWRF